MSREPVGYTCHTIDECKDMVEQLVQEVYCNVGFELCTVDELQQLHKAWVDFDWVEFDQKMEEIRDANASLREWGNEEEGRVDELEEELEELKSQVDK